MIIQLSARYEKPEAGAPKKDDKQTKLYEESPFRKYALQVASDYIPVGFGFDLYLQHHFIIFWIYFPTSVQIVT